MATKKKAATINPVTRRENSLKILFSHYLYAQIKDEDVALGSSGISSVHQHYDNLCKKPSDRSSLKPRFGIDASISQNLLYLLTGVLDEIKEVFDDLANNASVEQIVEAASTIGGLTAMVFDIGKQKENFFRVTLIDAIDDGEWLRAEIKDVIGNIGPKGHTVISIVEGFNTFLKAMAFLMGKTFCAFEPIKLSGTMFCNELDKHGMEKNVIKLMTSAVREVVKKTKPKKADVEVGDEVGDEVGVEAENVAADDAVIDAETKAALELIIDT